MSEIDKWYAENVGTFKVLISSVGKIALLKNIKVNGLSNLLNAAR